MTGSDDSYIAWDGHRYSGSPPPGWYLAADNRWWPSQEQIRTGSQPNEQPPAADQPNTARSGPEPANRAPGMAPGEPLSGEIPVAEPVSADPAFTPNRPRPSNTGTPHRRRSRSRRRFKPGFLIPMLLFALFRCGADAVDSGPRPAPEITETTTFVDVNETAGDPRLGPVVIFSDDDLELVVKACGPVELIGTATNLSAVLQTFEVSLDVASDAGEVITQRWIGTVAADEVASVAFALPPEFSVGRSCLILDSTVTKG